MADAVSQMSLGLANKLVSSLEKAGLTGEDAQEVVQSKDNFVALRVVRDIKNRGLPSNTTQEQARVIMGLSFFGIPEAMRCFGFTPSQEELDALAEIPFSNEVLETVRETHNLVAVFPISIVEMRSRYGDRFRNWGDFDEEDFMHSEGRIGWRLVSLREAPSPNGSWVEQKALLDENLEMLSARVVAYTILVNNHNKGVHLLYSTTLTSSLLSDGSSVAVDHNSHYLLRGVPFYFVSCSRSAEVSRFATIGVTQRPNQ